jgi:hypothetical protein
VRESGGGRGFWKSAATDCRVESVMPRALGRFAKAEGRDGQPVLGRRPDGVDRGLSAIEVLGGLGSIEQELEETLQDSFGRTRELNDKTHRPSCLRLASSFDCSPFRTVSTGAEAPVR